MVFPVNCRKCGNRFQRATIHNRVCNECRDQVMVCRRKKKPKNLFNTRSICRSCGDRYDRKKEPGTRYSRSRLCNACKVISDNRRIQKMKATIKRKKFLKLRENLDKIVVIDL